MEDSDSRLLQTLLLVFDRAMLVSRCGDGLRARPTTLAHTRDTKRVWLLCGVLGDGLHDLEADPNVNVVLQDGVRFCSVTGTARVVRHARDTVKNAAKRNRPLLTLIEVTPQVAEYWDRSGPKGLKFDTAEAGAPYAPAASNPRPPESRSYDNVISLESARWRR
ncbi:MAG TPA: pyridoxamine 5'-phosphate oxidase family protein [Gammaproteobacteria bacterium]|jgi:general stress protein 26|nr:pyridoxamine 5'-phosphate oxidase family protein [Gammaproteobacteria bacterium]